MKYLVISIFLILIGCATQHKIRENKVDKYIRIAEQNIKDKELDLASKRLKEALDFNPNYEQTKEINILFDKLLEIRYELEKPEREAREKRRQARLKKIREEEAKIRKETPGTLEYRQEYVKNHQNLSKRIKNCILKGKIRLGMTKEQVEVSWGKPRDINKSVGSWGVHEQWIYRKFSHSTYLYFENGILTSWQD